MFVGSCFGHFGEQLADAVLHQVTDVVVLKVDFLELVCNQALLVFSFGLLVLHEDIQNQSPSFES